jgi:hypothetical protein
MAYRLSKKHVVFGVIGITLGLAGSALADVVIKNQGAVVGPVTSLDCRGTGVTCSRSGSTGRITIDASDGGVALPTPTDDNVLLANGTAWAGALVPSCTGGSAALRYSQTSNTFTCNTSIAASTATALAADPTDCGSGQFATAIAANGNLTCSTPTDHRGSYTFGGFSPATYPVNLQFARYKALSDGSVSSMHFVITTAAASGTSGQLKLVEESSGTIVCFLNVTCTSAIGTGFDGTCGEGAGLIKAGNVYKFLWDSTTKCNVVQGGTADVVVSEG